MTKICLKCKWPLMVIKASTGICGWTRSTFNSKYVHKVSEPILLYKCTKCGGLWDEAEVEKITE